MLVSHCTPAFARPTFARPFFFAPPSTDYKKTKGLLVVYHCTRYLLYKTPHTLLPAHCRRLLLLHGKQRSNFPILHKKKIQDLCQCTVPVQQNCTLRGMVNKLKDKELQRLWLNQIFIYYYFC